MTIRLVGAEFFHSDRQTNGQANRCGLAINRFSQYCDFFWGVGVVFILTVVYYRLRYLEEGLKGKLRLCLEKISLDLEEEKELGMQLG